MLRCDDMHARCTCWQGLLSVRTAGCAVENTTMINGLNRTGVWVLVAYGLQMLEPIAFGSVKLQLEAWHRRICRMDWGMWCSPASGIGPVAC
jgi:hypothetical protein